jgi:hypothetical protein
MDSSSDKLTPLQHEVLRAVFAHERGFFLTGGAALAGFYLRHRETGDLDFFTIDSGAFVADLVRRLRRAAAPR